MNKLIISVLFIISFPVFAETTNTVPINTIANIKEVLIEAKVAGMCGALKQLSAFQETTRMKGGD